MIHLILLVVVARLYVIVLVFYLQYFDIATTQLEFDIATNGSQYTTNRSRYQLDFEIATNGILPAGIQFAINGSCEWLFFFSARSIG